MKGLILAASFARLDYPFKPALRIIAALTPPRAVPTSLLSWLLMGRSGTAELQASLRATLNSVAALVLRNRAKEALRVDASGYKIAVPTLYLTARDDKIVPSNAADQIAQMAVNFSTITIGGPHFLLQTQPQNCAAAVKRFHADHIRSTQ